MEIVEFVKQAHDYALIYHKHLENATDANWRKVITAERKFLKWIISNQVEKPVKPANGDIAIDILDEKEKYYRKLLKEDVKNHDHIACIVCESKLDFINEMQKELVSRLSV